MHFKTTNITESGAPAKQMSLGVFEVTFVLPVPVSWNDRGFIPLALVPELKVVSASPHQRLNCTKGVTCVRSMAAF